MIRVVHCGLGHSESMKQKICLMWADLGAEVWSQGYSTAYSFPQEKVEKQDWGLAESCLHSPTQRSL